MLKGELTKYISKNGSSHILIHSDILFGFKVKFESPEQFFREHIQEINEVCQSSKIIMPSFNYDFCKGIPYELKNTESQVGAISEYFRKNVATWRSSTPVFNFSGTGENPITDHYDKIDPFGENTIFGFLHRNKGLLMHYGSGFQTTTLIQRVERLSCQRMFGSIDGITVSKINQLF